MTSERPGWQGQALVPTQLLGREDQPEREQEGAPQRTPRPGPGLTTVRPPWPESLT